MSTPRFSGRPRVLNAMTVFFFALPPVNYLVKASLSPAQFTEPERVLATADGLGLIVLFFPLAVGAGLILARKWGFWLFMTYAPTLIAFNVRSFASSPDLFNAAALAETALAFAVVAYFMQKDIYKPLLAADPRGWRKKPRWKITVDISVDGVALQTRDFGENGCYLRWSGGPRPAGETVHVQIELGGRRFELEGVIARVEEAGAGIAFRNVGDADARALGAAIRVAAPADREARMPRHVVAAGGVLAAAVLAGLMLAGGQPSRGGPLPDAKTACEIAYNDFWRIESVALKQGNKVMPWGRLPDARTFLARCGALTEQEQVCLQAAYPAAHPGTCDSIRERLLHGDVLFDR